MVRAIGVTRRLVLCAVLCLLALSVATTAGAGELHGLRDNVRLDPTPAPAPPPAPRPDPPARRYDDEWYEDDDPWGDFFDDEPGLACLLTVGAFTSPFWGPHCIIDDGWVAENYFPRFPYHDVPGYMVDANWPSKMLFDADAADDLDVERSLSQFRRFSARLRTDYGTNFDDLNRWGSHLLVSTTSRWGLDTEIIRWREDLPGGTYDELWMADCNLVLRFAQGPHMQWRTGLGFNFLDDELGTESGFNFTYGVDCFPVQPWVFSATLDWGTLGDAEQFRFRTTAGVVLWRVESYVGYEYYDLDSTHFNTLISGVRLWF